MIWRLLDSLVNFVLAFKKILCPFDSWLVSWNNSSLLVRIFFSLFILFYWKLSHKLIWFSLLAQKIMFDQNHNFTIGFQSGLSQKTSSDKIRKLSLYSSALVLCFGPMQWTMTNKMLLCCNLDFLWLAKFPPKPCLSIDVNTHP